MPSHPEEQENGQQKNIERIFLGLPPNAVLPQVVGAKKQWAERMGQKVRRAAGNETIGVAVARIGDRQIRLPDPIGDPGVDPVGDDPRPYPGSGHTTTTIPAPGIEYTNTEPVIVVTLDTSKLDAVPSWVQTLDVRVVNRPDAEIIPSSFGLTDIVPDKPQIPAGTGGNGSVFEASLTSGVTLAVIAGGFGAAYYLFGPEGSS